MVNLISENGHVYASVHVCGWRLSCIVGRPSVYNSLCFCSLCALFTSQGISIFISTFLLWRESGAFEWWLQLEKWSHSLHVWKHSNYSDWERVIPEQQVSGYLVKKLRIYNIQHWCICLLLPVDAFKYMTKPTHLVRFTIINSWCEINSVHTLSIYLSISLPARSSLHPCVYIHLSNFITTWLA